MTLDLHGYTVEEATSQILVALISFDASWESELVIITGKGMNFIMNATLNLLDEEQRVYEVREAKVIVYKNFKRPDDKFEISSNWIDELSD